MKKNILDSLHKLATDMEDIGLNKYAEQVNDVFETVADLSEQEPVLSQEPNTQE